MSPTNGLAILDCAACGCPLFSHIVMPESFAEEIPLLDEWGPLPACTTQRPDPGKTPSFRYCPCVCYQAPLVFSYAQVLELLGVMGARSPETALASQRNHRPTGRNAARPRSPEQT